MAVVGEVYQILHSGILNEERAIGLGSCGGHGMKGVGGTVWERMLQALCKRTQLGKRAGRRMERSRGERREWSLGPSWPLMFGSRRSWLYFGSYLRLPGGTSEIFPQLSLIAWISLPCNLRNLPRIGAGGTSLSVWFVMSPSSLYPI